MPSGAGQRGSAPTRPTGRPTSFVNSHPIPGRREARRCTTDDLHGADDLYGADEHADFQDHHPDQWQPPPPWTPADPDAEDPLDQDPTDWRLYETVYG